MSLAGLSTLSTWSTLPGYQANLPEPFRASVWNKVLHPVTLQHEVVTPRPTLVTSYRVYIIVLSYSQSDFGTYVVILDCEHPHAMRRQGTLQTLSFTPSPLPLILLFLLLLLLLL